MSKSNKRKKNVAYLPRKIARTSNAITYNSGGVRGALGGTANNAIHRFMRTDRLAQLVQHTSAVGTVSSNGYYFSLDQIPSYTEFTALFDQYRIDKIELCFIPVANAVAPTGSTQGQLTTVIDYDDATVLATEAGAFNYESAQVVPVWQIHKRVLKPRIAMAGYAGAFSSYVNIGNQWIDSASPSVQHYGLKAIVGPASGALVMSWDIIVKYYFSCRNTR
jgi:hypothetical protein